MFHKILASNIYLEEGFIIFKIQWKQIILDNEVSNYMISNTGMVFNTKTRKSMRSIPNKLTGYRTVTLCKDGVSHTFGIHVLVATYYVNKPQGTYKRLEVNHIDGNKSNNFYTNLEWVTHSENVIHAFKTGLNQAHPKRGIEHWNAKQNEETIHQVCRMIQDGYDTKTIVEKLGVPKDLIGHIKYHNAWADISSLYNIHNKYHINLSQILPQRSAKYPEKIIRNICKLLELNKSYKEISNETGVKKEVIYDIKRGRIWRFYSEQYNIEYTNSYQPTILYLLVMDCLNQDINSVQDIIEYHKLPDINDIHIYIENVRNNYMKQ